jgi:hypothetical protein
MSLRLVTGLRLGFAFALTLTSVSASANDAKSPDFRAELGLRWAPIHHQDVNRSGRHALGGAADYVTRFDFDGDFDPRNNWDNCGDPRYPLAAHAYFSVTETRSHWFLTYLFFHPRDWSSHFFETEHENDAEGLLLAVERDGTRLGALRAAVTVVHNDFYSYVPEGSPWQSGHEDIDGGLSLMPFEGELHPVTAQQAETHALKAWPYYSIKREGLVYYPSLTQAEVPESPNDRQVRYRLLDLLEPRGLWARRSDPTTFASFGSFAGNTTGGCGRGALWCTRNAAHAPWAWNDLDDAVPRGAMASDPALLLTRYFRIPERMSRSYRFNPFR